MSSRYRLRIEDVAGLEEKLWALREELRGVLNETELLIEAVEDADHGYMLNETIEPLRGAKDRAWEACQEARKHLREIAGCFRSERQGGKAVTDLARCVRNLIQADHACTLGRSGCEHRWDEAMKALKAAIGEFRE